jgi:hypothetical protein
MFDDDLFNGGSKTNRGYTQRMIKALRAKKEEEDLIAEEIKKETAKNPPKEEKKDDGRGLLQKAGGLAAGIGKEIYRPFRDTAQNIEDVLDSEGANRKMNQNSDLLNRNTKEWSKFMRGLKDEDWQKPEVQEKMNEYRYKSYLLQGRENELEPEKIPKNSKLDPDQGRFVVNKDGTINMNTPVGDIIGAKKTTSAPKSGDPYAEFRGLALTEDDKRNLKEVQSIDAKKAGLDAAESWLNIATLGIGTGAVQGVKAATQLGAKEGAKAAGKAVFGQSGKELAKRAGSEAAIGGAYGITQTLRMNPEETGLDDYAKNVLLGASIGAAVPIAGRVGKHVLKGTDQAAGKAVSKAGSKVIAEQHEAMTRALRQVGEDGVVGTVNKALSRAGRKTVYAGSDLLGKTKTGAKMIDLKDDFMSKWVSNFHPLYKTLKRTDFEGKTEGAYIATREAIGNSNRALSYAQDYLDNDPNMLQLTGTISARNKNLVKSLADFDEYAKVRSELDLVNAGKKSFSKKEVTALQARYDKFTDNGWDDAYHNLIDFYKGLNDFRLENGLISEDDYSRFADEGFDYVRQQRELPDWLLDKPKGLQSVGGSKASITKSDAIQKRNKYASQELLSPMETAIRTAQLAHVEAYRNKAAKTVFGFLNDVDEADLLRSTDIVREKQGLLTTLKETRPIVNKMTKTVRSQKKQVQRLQTALNDLNKEGLHLRLKTGGNSMSQNFSPEGLGGEVPTSQAGKNKPIDFVVDEAGNARGNDAAKIARNSRTATDEKAIADAYLGPNTGEPGLIPTGEGTDAAKKAYEAAQRNKDIIKISGSADEQPVWASKLGSKDTKAFLNSLVTEDPARLKQIRKMIEGRDEKLGPLLDTLEVMNRDLHEMYTMRSETWQAAQKLKTGVNKGPIAHMSFLEDGVENIAKIDPDIASAVHNWNNQSQNVMGEILRFSNNVFKYGTTGANAGFALPNFVADQIGSAINSRNIMATHSPINFAHSLFMAIGKPIGAEDADILRGYLAGNKGQTLVNQYTKIASSKKAANDLVAKNAKTGTKAYTLVTNPRRALRALFDKTEGAVGFTENLTRIQNYRGTMRAAQKKGIAGKLTAGAARSGDDATKLANQAARENSVDFLEAGDYGRMVNNFIPYFNATIQGSRTMLRNAAERPVSFTAKTAALVGMPLAASTMWNTSDEGRKAIYDTIPEYVKETNFIVVQPGAKWNDEKRKWDGVILMKKPPGYKEFSEPVRKFIEYKADNGEGAEFSEFFKEQGGSLASDFGQSLQPIDFSSPGKFLSSVTPQILKPTAEAILNKNFFQDEDIVKGSMQDLPPEDQKYDQYSKVTAHIAGMFNTSPLKVDHWIRATFGEVGTNAQNLADRAITDNPDEIGGRSLEESVTRRFYGAPGGADTDAFYENYNPALSKRKTVSSQVTQLVKAGRINEAKRRAEEYNSTVGDRFGGFMEKYQTSPNYDPEWDDKINDLVIKTSDAAFKARRRQK